jgi:hypothetical protein
MRRIRSAVTTLYGHHNGRLDIWNPFVVWPPVGGGAVGGGAAGGVFPTASDIPWRVDVIPGIPPITRGSIPGYPRGVGESEGKVTGAHSSL